MKECDVVVVGGGAAGLSAALVLVRARRMVVVVDAGAPRNAPAAHLHGFLSRDGMPPRGLPAPVAEELERHLASYAEPDPDALVFTATKGSALRATNFRRRTWRAAVRAAELDGLRIHDLRHTAVALWIAAGASPKEVARRAGHTSVKTVLDVYGHLYDEADVALRERLEAMFVPVVALRRTHAARPCRYPRPVLIKARLKGHEFDLLTLAELFRKGDPAVATDDEGYYLSFTAPDGLLDDGSRLYDAASVLLRRVNGVARTLSSDFRPVGLTGRFDDEAGRQAAVVLADSVETRARVNPVTLSVGGQQPPPPPAPGPGYVQLAQTHPDVAEVLDILGSADPAPDWSDLYKVHEIMLANVPGFYQRGWVTKDQISTFTASANRKEVSGELARHARLKGDPPKRTMTLVEARQLIGALVTTWLDWLRSSSSP